VEEDRTDIRGPGFIAEGFGFVVRIGAPSPRLRGAAENLDRLRANILRAVDGLVEAAGGGDVGADLRSPALTSL
jgi:hypothetical protein